MNRVVFAAHGVYTRHPRLVRLVGISTKAVSFAAKAAAAVWAVALMGGLARSPECLVAPGIGDIALLRAALAGLAAALALQFWAPPWVLMTMQDRQEALGRQIAGLVATLVPPFLVALLAVLALAFPERGGPRRETCAGSRRLLLAGTGGLELGIFELCALVANAEGTVLAALCVLSVALATVGSAVLFAVSPLLAFVIHLADARSEKALAERIEEVPYADGSMPSECCICLESFTAGETCRRLPCNSTHLFHSECLQFWLQRSTLCPLCRTDILKVRICRSEPSPSPPSPLRSVEIRIDNGIVSL